MVGGVFTGLTVRRKLLLAESPSGSRTVTVMVAEPFWLLAGIMVTDLAPPLPPNWMLAVGTSTGFDELAERIKLLAAVSGSLTVKAMGALLTFSLMTRF